MAEFKTAISTVVPGRVLIRGYSHEEIMRRLTYAEGTFVTLFGRLPSAAETRLVDAMLTSLLDHGWVASTITTARYAASGNPQLVPAVAAGLLAAGRNTVSPEHSFRAIAAVVDAHGDSDSIPEAAREVVRELVAKRQRVPGLGHPVHRSADFRAEVLFELAHEVGLAGPSVAAMRALRAATHEITGRDLPINIDGCLAAIGRDLGWSAEQVVAIALLSVLPGVMAHVIEEIEQNVPLRYIRDGEYVGAPERTLPDRNGS